MLYLLLVFALDTLPPTLLAPPAPDTVWMATGNPLAPLVPFEPKKWTRQPAVLPPRKQKKNEP